MIQTQCSRIVDAAATALARRISEDCGLDQRDRSEVLNRAAGPAAAGVVIERAVRDSRGAAPLVKRTALRCDVRTESTAVDSDRGACVEGSAILRCIAGKFSVSDVERCLGLNYRATVSARVIRIGKGQPRQRNDGGIDTENLHSIIAADRQRISTRSGNR